MHRHVAALILAGASWLIQPVAGAEDIESLQAIQQRAQAFVYQQLDTAPAHQIKVRIDPPDPRLRLAKCGSPPEVFLPAGARLPGNASIGARCAAPRPWTVYLPATVKVFDLVVVTARTLPRGATVGEQDVRLERRELGSLTGGYFLQPAETVNLVTRRPLGFGEVLTSSALAAPRVVRRGDKITISAAISHGTIQAEGEALADGASGDRVKVRNTYSRRVVEGLVAGPGLVEVSP